MRTFKISESRVAHLSPYAHYVIEEGHIPGVLSGACLRGKAKKYGASYARTREKVERIVREATDGQVLSVVVYDAERRTVVRVWATRTRERVQLVIEEDEG